MPNKTYEIILKASDQFTDQTKKAQAQFAAMKIAADDFNNSVKKLEKLHPGLSPDEARAAAEALNRLKSGTDETAKSFANANIAARGLSQELGITLPRAVTSFLAQTKLIGPALSAAFSTVAIIGIVEALGQIPAAYDKIVGALTGWNDKSKETYKQLIEDNQRALQELTKFQAKLADISGGSGNQVTLNEARGRATANQQAATAARNQQNGFSAISSGIANLFAPGSGNILGPLIDKFGGPGTEDAQHFQENANKAAEDVIKAQNDIALANAQATEDLKKQQQAYTEFFAKQLETFKNSTFSTQVETHDFAQSIIKDWKDLATEEQKAGDEYIQYQEFFNKQLEEFRIKAPGTAADVEAGVKVGDENAKKIIKSYEEAQKQQKEFVKTFQEDVGKVWDEFRQKGLGAFADLANYIGKKFTEGLLTQLLFGSGGTTATSLIPGIGGGVGGGGGLLGGLIGKLAVNSGPWSEAIPGGGGGGGLFGGLFGGGLGGLLTNNSAAANAAGGTLGLGVSGAGPGISSGLGGALGLNGGAGLLGLGAATIPVFGAVALGIGAALISFFGNHRQAPFTRDPDQIQNTREYLFYTGASALADAAKDISSFSHRLDTLPPGVLTKQGLPVALGSSNQFRNQISSMLNP